MKTTTIAAKLAQAKADDTAAVAALRAGDYETYKQFADQASAARKQDTKLLVSGTRAQAVAALEAHRGNGFTLVDWPERREHTTIAIKRNGVIEKVADY